jgi:hypothetical protein
MRVASPFSVPLELSWRRIAAIAKRPLIVVAVFGILVYFGAQSGRDLFFRSIGSMQWSGSGPQRGKPAEALREIDPVSRFTQTHVGHLLFSSRGSDMCRRVLFDNRTGATREAGVVVCGQPQDAPAADQQERGNAMMRAFRR